MRIDLRIIALLLISLTAIVACTPLAASTVPTPTATLTATPEPTATATLTPTRTPVPTPTPSPPCEPSGVAWITRFPTSQSIDDLAPEFRDKVNRFIAALKAAKAGVKISETYRSRERAYLMHYAYAIAREGLDPVTVPTMEGVNICWVQRDAKGRPDLAASKRAAQEMVKGYNIVFKPTLDSDHIQGLAIDMTITWQGELRIRDAKGKLAIIKSEPRNGTNTELQKVGATYDVAKLANDPPHWSGDGK